MRLPWVATRMSWIVCFLISTHGLADSDPLRPYRVATYNFLHDFPNFEKLEERLEILIDAVKSEEIDVIGLQEASATWQAGNVAKRLARRLGFYHAYFKLELDQHWFGFENGLAIVSRYPILEAEKYRFKKQNGIFERRSVIRALIQAPKGPLTVYSTHLSGKEEEINFIQALELIDFVTAHRGEYPSLIMGDFNAEPSQPSIQHLTARLGAVEVYESTHPTENLKTCCVCIREGYYNWFDPCPRESGSEFLERTDYLFLVPGTLFTGEVVSSERFLEEPSPSKEDRYLWGSDHIGIRADVKPY